MSDSKKKAEEIFLLAAEMTSPQAQRVFLDQTCADDPHLRREVETLLRHDADAGSFLEKPLHEIDASVIADAVEHDAEWRKWLEPSDDPQSLGALGDYEIDELVGRGGMGLVFRARDRKLNRTVAVKALTPALLSNPMAVRRFVREAQAAAAVSHDHVVTIHAIEEQAQPPRIVMQFIQGQSLQEKIDRVGALDLRSILRMGRQIALGLAAAHQQGLVHRDIKPSNILLENGVERVQLTDFGLARAVDDIGVTRTGQITGTPQYMSPEQALGKTIDHRTDLFSLGCVLYAMCTGQAAFRADSAVAVMHRIVHEQQRPIVELNEDIPVWLVEVVQKLLAKDANERFQSANEVAERLEQHLKHLQQPSQHPLPAPLNTVLVQPATPTSNPIDAKPPKTYPAKDPKRPAEPTVLSRLQQVPWWGWAVVGLFLLTFGFAAFWFVGVPLPIDPILLFVVAVAAGLGWATVTAIVKLSGGGEARPGGLRLRTVVAAVAALIVVSGLFVFFSANLGNPSRRTLLYAQLTGRSITLQLADRHADVWYGGKRMPIGPDGQVVIVPLRTGNYTVRVGTAEFWRSIWSGKLGWSHHHRIQIPEGATYVEVLLDGEPSAVTWGSQAGDMSPD